MKELGRVLMIVLLIPFYLFILISIGVVSLIEYLHERFTR